MSEMVDPKQRVSTLSCIACGHQHDPLTRQFRCSRCDDLLELKHDLEQIRSRYGDLRRRFEQRLCQLQQPYNSGVWRYHELVLPDLDPQCIVSLPEGNTPLYVRDAIRRYVGAARVWIKHEGQNPTLSFKDRGMTAGVSWAKRAGAPRVACASTGDTSAAMAAYAAAAELIGVVLLPHDKVSVEQLAQPISYGARVLALDTDFDGCMSLVKQLTADGDIYLLNSMNPFRIEGQKTIGLETLHQLNWQVPDWFVIPVGNAGNISALGKGLLEAQAMGLIDRLPRVAGIQVVAADPFYQSYRGGFSERLSVTAQPTVASAIRIGDPVSFDKARRTVVALNGVVSEVTDEEALAAMAESSAAGVHICPNSGVAVAGAKRLVDEGTIGRKESAVIIATAHGGKFSQSTIAFHSDQQSDSARKNPPRQLTADLAVIRQAIGTD